MPRLRSRRLAVIAGPPLIVLVLALLVLGASRRVGAEREVLQRSHAVADAAEGVLLTVLQAESGQRGFVLTGEPSYLGPWLDANRTAVARLDTLRALVPEGDARRPAVDSLSAAVNGKFAELAATIRARQERGEAAARAIVLTGRGQRLTDQVRAHVERIVAREQRIIQVDAAADAARTRLTILALAGGVALAIVLAFLVNLLLAREGARAEASRVHASSILESIGDAFFALDAEWRFTYLNARGERLLQRTAAELLGRRVWDEFPESLGTAFETSYRGAVASGEPVTFEAFYPPLDAWFEVRAYPAPGLLSVYFSDVTERRRVQAERALLLETMPQLVWSTTAEGYHDYYNSRWHEYTGMPREGAQGWNWKTFLHPDDYERTLAVWQHSLATGAPYEIEYRFREAATGRYRWFLGRALPMRDETGRIVRWFGTCTDIDRAKRAEEGSLFLAEASASLGASLEWEAALADVARLAVPRLADWCGVHARGADGEWRLLTETSRTPASPGATLAFPLAAGGEVVGELRLAMTDSHRTFDDDDEALAAELAHRASLAVERARLYRDANAARVEAERANRAKSDFLATMSHELRTPLNAISGYTDLLLLGLRGDLSDAQLEDMRRIQRASQHLLSLIVDILNYARLEAGTVELREENVPLDETLETIEALLHPQLEAKGLHFASLTCDRSLEARADPEKLRQVLVNLLGNAIKFTDAGGEVALLCDADATRVRITVRDTGRGIPADRLEEIFDPFVQVDRHRTAESQQGVGLGLAISRDLARAMGGDITVRSEPGRGSAFTLELPRAYAAPVARSA